MLLHLVYWHQYTRKENFVDSSPDHGAPTLFIRNAGSCYFRTNLFISTDGMRMCLCGLKFNSIYIKLNGTFTTLVKHKSTKRVLQPTRLLSILT